MYVKEMSYSESQKISTKQYESLLVSFSATASSHEGQDPEETKRELILFVKNTLKIEVEKVRKG